MEMCGVHIPVLLYCCTSVLKVKSIAEMGAYVSLLEYNGIEGMILLSELSRRRIRSITKLIKVPRCRTFVPPYCRTDGVRLYHFSAVGAVGAAFALSPSSSRCCTAVLMLCQTTEARQGTLLL